MDILWLSHLVPYPPRSGVAQRSYGLLRELCRRHDVTLLAFHQPALMSVMSEDPRSALEHAVEHLSAMCARVEVFDIPWERMRFGRYALALSSLFRKRPYTINWLESREFSRALLDAGPSEPELVHFDTISLAIFRKCFRDAVCVMNHHNIESHLLRRRARNADSWLARAYYSQEAARLERYERQAAPGFDLHVTCSELDRQRLLEISPGLRCCVIPNGVDIGYFGKQVCSSPEPTFSFVGTLGWGPNRDAARTISRDLWPAIAAKWPNAKMYLVGSNPPRCAIDLAARDARFIVTGFANDVRPYMAESSFFLCPIREGGGTKLKVLNAMAMGKVVIADPVACEGIDVSPSGDVLLARTTEEYVARINDVLTDRASYARIAETARRTIETRYSYEVIGHELDRRYTSMVRMRGGPQERESRCAE